MTMFYDRYPEDLILTVDDFTACGWKAALVGATCEGYRSMCDALSDAAKQATQNGQKAHGKVLWLLADACSMILAPASTNKPYKSRVVSSDGRSLIPDDLLETDIAFFAQIVDVIDDSWLKARLADLVWLRQTPRKVKFALAAIDSYRLIPLETEAWWHGGKQCWQRAIRLALMCGVGAGNRLTEMEASILDAFQLVTKQDGFLAFELADLLKINGLAGSHSTKIAIKLESLAHEFEDEENFYYAREYFQSSANWFKASGDDAKSTAMTVAEAEGWVKEALAKVSSDQPSHLAAAIFYEKAIQTYRTIPWSERAIHRVDERIAGLRARLNESGEKSLDEMNVVSTPGVDINQIVEDARNAVRDKEAVEALKAFANLCSGAKVKELRKNAIEKRRRYPLLALFPTNTIGSGGCTIAKDSGEDEKSALSQMIRDYGIRVGIVVQGYIWPAHEILLLEHRLQEADFIALARRSSIVPIGRELLFGKALFAGYDRDFVTALHILVPQIEHMVRSHLKQARVQTTNIDGNGIENENGLSSLMDLPQTEKIFGEDLSFEIKALLCDSFGPNLRNEFAHGLIDYEACQSAYAIYAWWLGLKLVFNPFWNALLNETESKEQGEE